MRSAISAKGETMAKRYNQSVKKMNKGNDKEARKYHNVTKPHSKYRNYEPDKKKKMSKHMDQYKKEDRTKTYTPPKRHEKKGMIHEDYKQVANLPQYVKYVPYPDEAYYHHKWLNDTISGIDDQINRDVKGMNKSMARKKGEKY